MMKKVMFGLMICAAMTMACKKSSNSASYTPDCTGAAKSYSSNVAPILQGSCSGCHSQFASYPGVSADRAAIRSKIVDGSMPQGGSLTVAQKNSIVCWIDSGALNN